MNFNAINIPNQLSLLIAKNHFTPQMESCDKILEVSNPHKSF